MNLSEFLISLEGKKLNEANNITEKICGVVNFFESENYTIPDLVVQPDKAEYGDWQTNFDLAYRVCLMIKNKDINPHTIIEPTCGTGTFILASIIVFGGSVKKIYGIDIYKPYLTQLKFRLLDYALKNPNFITCKVYLLHQNIFGFNFESLGVEKNKNVLIIGNPPWVTNTKLSEISSDNLPPKSNFKNVKGLEAITGKSNFDIAEFITYQLLNSFHNLNACLAFLVKSSVAKNIVYEQKNGKYNIKRFEQYTIDAKKEFDVSVSACLFIAEMGTGNAKQCSVRDLYKLDKSYSYGWVNNHFVSNVEDYLLYSSLDGKCQLVWWSGMKHDCSKVMELEKRNGILYNKLGESVNIEPDLVYPILKSSDLKDEYISSFRKYVIVTQTTTSDDTSKIEMYQPLTYTYLTNHLKWFEKRGSIIYKKRSKFCIFGIGEYSFKKYKIAIAGLYKRTTFSLVSPLEDKPVMLDDTCYMLGFDTYDMAKCFLKILNSSEIQHFLHSLMFSDAKRSINKDMLMRINLAGAIELLYSNKKLTEQEYHTTTTYIKSLNKNKVRTLDLFANVCAV